MMKSILFCAVDLLELAGIALFVSAVVLLLSII